MKFRNLPCALGWWAFFCLVACIGSAEGTTTDKAAYIKSDLPQCGLHLYRHLSKTGGTTLRFIFDKQTAMGEWEYPIVYGFKPEEWAGLLTRWKNAADEWFNGTREVGPRVLVEVRGNWPSNWPAENFIEKVLPDVLRLKKEYIPKGCQISTSLLMREPLTQYLSFYHYYIEKQQKGIPGPGQKGPDVPGTANWGANISEWAVNVKDMQVRELLGTKCTPQMRQAGYTVDSLTGTRTGVRHVPKQCHVTAQEVSTAKALVREMDVVGVTENFPEFILMLADKVGIQHCQHTVSNTGSGERRRTGLPPETIHAIHQVTTSDQEIHRVVEERQRIQIEDAGPDFASRLQIFKDSQVRIGSRTFVGGKPAPSPYKWVDEAEALRAGVERVVPKFLTEPKGGGQAIAYIYFQPVMLARHDSNLPCRKGCTFD